MLIVEEINLADPETGRRIVEKRFVECSEFGGADQIVAIEWWGLMGVIIHANGRPVGQEPVPFRIQAENRVQAFANLQSSMDAAAEQAKRQVDQKIKQAQSAAARQILMPGPLTIQQ